MIYDLIIIGAGAAGLFAAASAHPSLNVLVLEKGPEPGRKLLLAGNGRCNLTHAGSVRDFLSKYGDTGRRLRPVLFPFSNQKLAAWFKERALPLTTRADGKVFPASMDSRDVLNTLLSAAKANGTKLKFSCPAKGLSFYEKGGSRPFIIQADQQYTAKNVLIATGGASYPQTGSDGTFFSCLENLQIPLTPRHPALVPVLVKDYPYSKLSGISFPGCEITIFRGQRATVKGRGGLLFTHRCFSGPVILDNSRYICCQDKLSINYLPQYSSPELRKILLSEISGCGKQITTLLEVITGLPRRFLDTICLCCGVSPDLKSSRLSGTEITGIAEKLTADSHIVRGTAGYSAAMVTAGGISLDAVNLNTMGSLQYPGLYFAGEVLDVDGDTGGYNLQFAFSSAHLAAELN